MTDPVSKAVGFMDKVLDGHDPGPAEDAPVEGLIRLCALLLDAHDDPLRVLHDIERSRSMDDMNQPQPRSDNGQWKSADFYRDEPGQVELPPDPQDETEPDWRDPAEYDDGYFEEPDDTPMDGPWHSDTAV